MDPLLAYTLAPMHLSSLSLPRVSGKPPWKWTSTPTRSQHHVFVLRFQRSSRELGVLGYYGANKVVYGVNIWWNTHLCVVNGICNGLDDSHVVQGVLDTQETHKIPLLTVLPSKNPPTIPVPKKNQSSVRRNKGMWGDFFKNISHTTSNHTVLKVL